MSDGVLTFKAFNCDISKVISSRGLDTGGKVQQYIDSEVLRLNEPFVPKDTGELIQSGIKNTEIGSGEVKYNGYCFKVDKSTASQVKTYSDNGVVVTGVF